MVSAEQMAAYVSAQVNALRYYSAATAVARPLGLRVGAAKRHRMPNADFGAQTDLILERMAAAIRDSGDVVEPRPRAAALRAARQDSLCAADVSDARHNEALAHVPELDAGCIGSVRPRSRSRQALRRPRLRSRCHEHRASVTSGPARAVTLRSNSRRGRSPRARRVRGHHRSPSASRPGQPSRSTTRHTRGKPHTDGVGSRDDERHTGRNGDGRRCRDRRGHAGLGRGSRAWAGSIHGSSDRRLRERGSRDHLVDGDAGRARQDHAGRPRHCHVHRRPTAPDGPGHGKARGRSPRARTSP